jgi:predicted neutral ceramidase superfamily lipid hydrolase
MEMLLLDRFILYNLASLIIVCLILTIVSCLAYLIGHRKTHGVAPFAIVIAAFSILGFTTGSIMSDSREPSVSAVLPAALTLMGGVAAFIVGTKGATNQILVSALILNFGLALFIGSDYGAVIRDEVALYDTGVADEKPIWAILEIKRLGEYVELLKLKHDYEEKYKTDYKLDLSKFVSSYERASDKEK